MADVAVLVLGLDLDRRGAVLVEDQLQLVAAQQVDAVERGVVGDLVELVLQLVELRDQVATHGVAADRGLRRYCRLARCR